MNARTDTVSERGQAALEYAAKGWHVFPCQPDDKHPISPNGLNDATTDPTTILRWWTARPDANIGVNLKASGLVAVDADTYKPDCGWRSFIEGRDLPTTLVQRSARGGTHYLFRAPPDAVFPGSLCPGVDIKHNGYILLEPSTFGGGVYQFQTDDEPAAAPDWLPRRREQPQDEEGWRCDTGERSEKQADDVFRLAAALGDIPNPGINWEAWNKVGMALWAATAGSEMGRILWREWSARASTNGPASADARWDHYRTSPPTDIGAGTIFYMAAEARRTRAEQAEGADGSVSAFQPTVFKLRPASEIPPRQWLYGRHLIRGFVSTTVAPGGLGKTSLIDVEALAMVTGRPLLGQAPVSPLRVWTWNGEDPADELERRKNAVCLHYGITASDLGDRLMVDSGRALPIKLAKMDKGTCFKIAKPVVEAMIDTLRTHKVDVLVIDPFVASHEVSENDNVAINAVASEWRTIADAAHCAVELVHHVSKAGAVNSDLGIYAARGAGALIDAVRSARVLQPMKQGEAERFGLQSPDGYFRVDNGKANLAPSDKAAWRRMVGVWLNNGKGLWPLGDNVGVCSAWIPPDPFAGMTVDDLARVQAAIVERAEPPAHNERAGDWVGYVIAAVMGFDIGAGRKAERTPAQNVPRARVRELLAGWLKSGALAVETIHDARNGRPVKVVVVGERA